MFLRYLKYLFTRKWTTQRYKMQNRAEYMELLEINSILVKEKHELITAIQMPTQSVSEKLFEEYEENKRAIEQVRDDINRLEAANLKWLQKKIQIVWPMTYTEFADRAVWINISKEVANMKGFPWSQRWYASRPIRHTRQAQR